MAKVAGQVMIEGQPAKRMVRAFSYDTITHQVNGSEISASKTLGQAQSDDTGAYEIELAGGYKDSIFVVAFDNYGQPFTASAAIAIGDRIHPTTPNGFVYECTTAGELPAGEPAWSLDKENSQPYGTAYLLAVPFYRALVHGPLLPISTINSGFVVLASAVSNAEYPQYDVTNEAHPDYQENFSQTKDFGLFRYAPGFGNTVYIPPTTLEMEWDESWEFDIYAINGTYVNDYQNMKLEWLDHSGAVVYTLETFRDSQYSANVRSGPPGSISNWLRTGYGRPSGRLWIENGVLTFFPNSDSNNVRHISIGNFPLPGVIKTLRATVEARTTVASGGASTCWMKLWRNKAEAIASLPGSTPAAIDSGFIMGAWCRSGPHAADYPFDMFNTGNADWAENWLQTNKVQAFKLAMAQEAFTGSGTAGARVNQTTIPIFDNKWIWEIRSQAIAYGGDVSNFRLEFLDAAGSLVYLITCEKNGDYRVRIRHGADDNSLSVVGGSGQAQYLFADLTFRPDGFDCVSRITASYVYSFSGNFDTTVVTRMRFSGYSVSTAQTGGTQGNYVKIIGRTP